MTAHCTQYTDRDDCTKDNCCMNDRYIEQDGIMVLVKEKVEKDVE